MPLFSNYTTCNLFTGAGMDHSIGGTWSMAMLALVILFFTFAFAKKWLFEEYMQQPFSLIFACVGAFIGHLIVLYFTCSYKFGLLSGIIAGFAAGYFGGALWGESSI